MTAQAAGVVWQAGQVPRLAVDGRLNTLAVTPGAPSGVTDIVGDTLEYGRGGRGAILPWLGLGGVLLFANRALSTAELETMTGALVDPRKAYGLGSGNLANDGNRSPVGLPILDTASAGVPRVLTVTTAAYDPNGDTLALVSASVVSGGATVTVESSTQIRYTPNSGIAQSLVIEVVLRDPGLKTTRARVYSTVAAPETGLEYPLPLPGQSYIVNTQAEFNTRLQASEPGDEILVNFTPLAAVTMSRSGTQANPIVVAGLNNQEVTVNGNVTLSGNNVQFGSMRMADTRRVIISGTRCRLHRVRVRYSGGRGILCTPASRSALIDYCEIDGGLVTPTSTSWTAIDLAPDRAGPASNHIVRRCWIHDCVATGDRDCCAIFAGTGQDDTDIRTGNLVEYVLVQGWNGDLESIANKSSDNEYRFVTLENSREFSNRHGGDNVYWGCWSRNSSGWDVFDTNNQILGCVVDGGDRFHVSNGEVTAAGWPDNANPTDGNHAQAANTIVAGCTGPLALGVVPATSGKGYDEPALNTIIEAHTGAIDLTGDHQGTVVRANLTGGRQVPVPVLMTVDKVGVFTPWVG